MTDSPRARSEWRFTVEDPFETGHDLGTCIFSREGQGAISKALQVGLGPHRRVALSRLSRSLAHVFGTIYRRLHYFLRRQSDRIQRSLQAACDALRCDRDAGGGKLAAATADGGAAAVGRLLAVEPCGRLLKLCNNCGQVRQRGITRAHATQRSQPNMVELL